MPAILGPTNPVPGQEQQPVRITTPPAGDTSVQNIVNPAQVTRPDNRTDRQDTGNAAQSFAARYESNFMTFLQRLRGSPDMAQVFFQIIQGGGLQVSSGIRAGFAEEIAQFMEFLQLDEGQLKSFLQNQVQSGTRFTGAIFSALRSAYAGTSSEVARQDILQFLHKFSDWSSTGHLEGKMLNTLGEMSQSLPAKWANQLTDLAARLENGVAAGDRQGNLKLLRGQVFPLISQYVSLTHNHGRARNLLSMLALDVARYENGSEGGLVQSLRRLALNGSLPRELDELSDADLMRLLRTTDYAKAAQSNSFADRLSELTGRAVQGEGGVEAQEAFRAILSAMLVNESVYMPLMHIMLPIQWEDKLMFSEMWVDPDADGDPRSVVPDGEGTTRLLLKLDIQDLGAFDLLINAHGTDVSLQAACPPAVAAFSDQVSQGLRAILARNGFRPDVSVGAMQRPVTVSEVFPRIFEKASGVNVSV